MRKGLMTAALLGVALTGSGLAAQGNDDLRKELDTLKKRVVELENERSTRASSNSSAQDFTDDRGDPRWGGERPAYSLTDEKAVGTENRVKAVDFEIGGYFSVVFRDDEGEKNAFDQHRFVPQLSFTIADRVRFDSEIEFEGGGADAGFLTDNEVLVEYAEVAFEIAPWFIPKAGLILVPFGRYNMIHDDPLHDLFDRPFVARRVVPSAFDQPGAAIAGDFSASHGLFHYDVALTQGFDDDFTSNGGSRGARQSFREDDNNNKHLWFRGSYRPNFGAMPLSLELGTSWNIGKLGVDSDDTIIGWGFDGSLKYDFAQDGSLGVNLEGEYARIDIDRDGPGVIDGLDGYYVQGTLRYRPWKDRDLDGWLRTSGYLGFTVRWEENDLNDNISGAAPRDNRQALTVGVSFRPFFKTVIRSEWKFTQSSDFATDDGDRFVISLSTYF